MTAGLTNRIAACEPKQNKFLVITLASGTAVQGSAVALQFTRATCYGYKAVANNAAPTANAADASIGYVDTDGGSGVAAGQPVFVDVVPKGSWIGMSALGTKYNLQDIYFLGTTGDKVLVQYEQ